MIPHEKPYYPDYAVTSPVWAIPLSLATTQEIDFSFFSSAGLQPAGLPHSDTCGSIHACRSPHIFAACRVLLRRRKPRHPPSAICSFFCESMTFVFACEIVLLRPISLLRFLYLVRLSLNIVNDLVFIPFFLKRAAKIRTFSLPPNFSAIFFHFFSKNFLAFLLMR